MLVVEVLKTVGQLASAISQKTKELDLLKREYEIKLQILDQYIAKVAPTELLPKESTSKAENITELLSKELRCSSCSNVVYSLKDQSDYVLVPLGRAQEKASDMTELLQSLRDLKLGAQQADNEQTPAVSRTLPDKPNKERTKSHGKLKRTCSYCNEPGHTRARCFARLSKDPSANPKASEKNKSQDPST